MDASAVSAERAETAETMDSSQGGAVDASSVPAGRAETAERMDSSQGGAMDASSVPTERTESDPGASAACIDQENGDDLPAVLSGREAHELSSWGWLPPTVMGRTRGQSRCLQNESAQISACNRGRDVFDFEEVDGVWEYIGGYILDDGGRIGHDGWRTCLGRQ